MIKNLTISVIKCSFTVSKFDMVEKLISAGSSSRGAGEDMPLDQGAQLHVPHDDLVGQDHQVLGHAQLRAHNEHEPV